MGQTDKLLERLQQKPTPADFRYADLKKVLSSFGYIQSNKGATSGSRVIFYHPDTKDKILLHKPHPGDQMVKASVEQVVNFLKEHGHI